jgi:5-methylcytosine-specific restriction endonuclease McrA
MTNQCANCGQTFHRPKAGHDTMKFCSLGCYWAVPRKRKPQPAPASRVWLGQCPTCSQWFASRKRRKYCTALCQSRSRLDTLNRLYWYSRCIDPSGEARGWREALLTFLRDRDGDKCQLCRGRRGPIRWGMSTGPKGATPYGPSIDHIIPRTKGGTDDPDNLRLTHWVCNRRRRNHEDYATQLMLGAAHE